jgi:hypothetical protein
VENTSEKAKPKAASRERCRDPSSTAVSISPNRPSKREAFEDPRRPRTARQSQTAYFLGQLFHHAPNIAAPARDFFFDHTPFLQKVIGESTPGEILKQLDEIDALEAAFVANLAESQGDAPS